MWEFLIPLVMFHIQKSRWQKNPIKWDLYMNSQLQTCGIYATYHIIENCTHKKMRLRTGSSECPTSQRKLQKHKKHGFNKGLRQEFPTQSAIKTLQNE